MEWERTEDGKYTAFTKVGGNSYKLSVSKLASAKEYEWRVSKNYHQD